MIEHSETLNGADDRLTNRRCGQVMLTISDLEQNENLLDKWLEESCPGRKVKSVGRQKMPTGGVAGDLDAIAVWIRFPGEVREAHGDHTAAELVFSVSPLA